jgi:hypothetical protein
MPLPSKEQLTANLRERAAEALRELQAARAEGRHAEARTWDKLSRQAHQLLRKAGDNADD